MADNVQDDISFEHLIEKNREWARRISADNPDFFPALARQQKPDLLWIGCSDSRVPANEIVDLPPGAVFVHRNISNVVVASDLNCLSTIQFAVDLLKVRHIIVTGHYGCGGVTAALNDQRIGLADHWIAHVREVYSRHEDILLAEPDAERRLRLLCELNVLEQVLNTSRLPTVLDAWARGQTLCIHGWCYGLEDGLVNDLKIDIDRRIDPTKVRAASVAHLLEQTHRR